MAFSQGAGPHNHSASHSVGRSQVRQRAPSSLIPERQTALKTQIPTQKTTRHSLLFAAIPEVQPFLQITCVCSAPKYRPWSNSTKEIRSALWVNPTEIPIVCLGEKAHRYDEKALADSPTGRNGLKNGFLDLGIFFFFPTERHKQPRSPLPLWRTIQTDTFQYLTDFRAERSPNTRRLGPHLGSLGPFSSQLSEQTVWHVSQWEEGFQAACAGRGRLPDPKPAAVPRRKQDAGNPPGAFGSPCEVKSRSESHRHAYFSARALAHACGNLQADPEMEAS